MLNHAAAHANPPSSARRAWRGWLLVVVAFWACLAPSWASAYPASGDKPAPSRACARAEKPHTGDFLGPAETHQENPAQVARLHRENEVVGGKAVLGRSVGSNSDPASLHKYNYGHGNPVSNIDPSGNITMADIQMAVANIGVLARMAIPTVHAVRAAVSYRLVMFTLSQMQQAAFWAALAGVGTLIDTNGDVGAAVMSAGMGYYFSGGPIPVQRFDTARQNIIRSTIQTLRPHVAFLKRLDPDVRVGFRGSLAKGYKGPHKNFGPFDGDDFDVDAFIVSDKLAAQFPKGTRARWGSALDLGENEAQIQEQLSNANGMGGLRKEGFGWRIFTRDEASKMQNDGDTHIYVNE